MIRRLLSTRTNDVARESVFVSREGASLDAENFRRRVWAKLLHAAWKGEQYLTPHSLRHTSATLHLANGTPVKWIQEQGG